VVAALSYKNDKRELCRLRISLAVLEFPALRGTAATLQGSHLLLSKLKVGQCRGQEIGRDRSSDWQQVWGVFGISRLRDDLSRRLERRDWSNLSQSASIVSNLSLTKRVLKKSRKDAALTKGAIVWWNCCSMTGQRPGFR
jgi:hypothetical protein